jgi:hypothetical protein
MLHARGWGVLTCSLALATSAVLARTPPSNAVAPLGATHHVYVAAVSNLGPIGLTDSRVLAQVADVASYWKHEANGAIADMVLPHRVVRFQAHAAQSDCGLGSDFMDMVHEAAASFPGIDLSGSDQLVVLVPATCASGGVMGEATVGTGFGSGGAVVVKAGSRIVGTLAHEAGHNYGLQHADVRRGGASLDQDGVYDVMSLSLPQFDQLTALSTPYRVAEGITDPGEIASLALGNELSPVKRSWTIKPRSSDSGLRSVRVVDPDTGEYLYLDYRCGCGVDAGAAYGGGFTLDHGTRVFHFRPGVVITAARGSGVDDLSWGAGDTSLTAGGTWTNRSGNLTVHVRSLGKGARVTVDFTPGVPVAPAPAPRIDGDVRVGGRLHAVTGTWMRGVTLRYQWLANGVPVPGASGPTFTPTRRQRGRTLRVDVTGARAGYQPVTRSSTETSRVARAAVR